MPRGEPCIDLIVKERHDRTQFPRYALQDESLRSHLVAFVLATVRHQDIPVVNLGSLPSSSGSRASGRIVHVKQGLSAADQGEYYHYDVNHSPIHLHLLLN